MGPGATSWPAQQDDRSFILAGEQKGRATFLFIAHISSNFKAEIQPPPLGHGTDLWRVVHNLSMENCSQLLKGL